MEYLILARHKVRDMTDRGMALPAIEQAFNMKEYRDWDRTEHLSWTADTIYCELKGEGPLVVRTTEKRVSGVVAKAVQDGRFVTVKAQDGTELQLRVTADTAVTGIADRTRVWLGMKLSALYQIPEGVNPSLGYNALEITVTP